MTLFSLIAGLLPSNRQTVGNLLGSSAMFQSSNGCERSEQKLRSKFRGSTHYDVCFKDNNPKSERI